MAVILIAAMFTDSGVLAELFHMSEWRYSAERSELPKSERLIEDLYRAIYDEGRRPDIHAREVRRLKKRWPTLWNSLVEFTTAYSFERHNRGKHEARND